MKENKLLQRMVNDINNIIQHYGFAASIVVHSPRGKDAPGQASHILNLETSYSCAKFNEMGVFEIKARLQEDFNGDQNAYMNMLQQTYEMASLLANSTGQAAVELYKLKDMLSDIIKAGPNDMGFSGNTAEKN